MDRNLFRATEKKLYNYFSKDKKIDSLRNKIKLLEQQSDAIENRIKHTDISIPIESRSIEFSERVTCSSDGTSYMERTMIKIIDNLLIEKARKEEEITKTEELIRSIEEDNNIIGYNIGFLSDESKKLLKLKYKDKKKEWEIGQEINLSQSRVNKLKNELIKDISNWDNWFIC
ncbi:hypothetical protein [Clostridium hydrogeniformans]|uniref:hypothetical protein n=1 Tax=Clostridium hydrogeniformans TaxID=349933 RepID=UPI000486A3AA|nr:hypothetical protein [Clostridium hydrogeniformans]